MHIFVNRYHVVHPFESKGCKNLWVLFNNLSLYIDRINYNFWINIHLYVKKNYTSL